MKNVGIDIGSTTVKVVVMDGENIFYRHYQRHLSQVRQTTREVLRKAQTVFNTTYLYGGASPARPDSALPKAAGIAFCTGGLCHRQNGACTMSPTPTPSSSWAARTQDHLLDRRPGGAHERQLRWRHRRLHRPDGDAVKRHHRGAGRAELTSTSRIYPIASRCGVFAKTDIQPLSKPGRPQGGSWPPASSRRWSTRPSPAWPRAAASRARCCFWAGRCSSLRACRSASRRRLKPG